MWKYISSIVLLIIFVILTCSSILASSQKTIYFFYGDGCSHCATVEEFFEQEKLYERYPIEKKEIYFNRENTILFQEIMRQLQIPQDRQGVPTIIIGDTVLVGEDEVIQNFENLAEAYIETGTMEISPTPVPTKISEPIELTILAVIGGAIVDAVNPCAFAVLIILMTTILAGGSRKKALFSGLAFTSSIFISYFLMGLGVYKALGIGSSARIFYQVVGWLAIILGILNFKDYFWYGKGVLMEVPLSWRPQLKKLISSVTNPLGAFLIGFLVSLFLLPCTSGPYIVILGMLAKDIQIMKALGYLLIYNLIFVTPMIVITLAVYKGYSVKKAESIRQNHLRTLHLIAGAVLVAMGFAIVVGLF